MYNLICEHCGKQFQAVNHYAKYCSVNCKSNAYHDKNRDEINRKWRDGRSEREKRRANGKYTHTCIYCGKTFRSNGKNATSCGKRDKLHRPDEKHKMVDVVCGYCGKIFQKPAGAYKAAVRDGKNQGCCQLHTHVLNGSTLSLTCSECGKIFTRAKSLHVEGQKHVFCSKECQDKNIDYILRGEEHYRYIDGKSSNWRGFGWTPIRKHVRERDNNTCYLCGITKDELGHELDVHHLVRFEDFEDPDEANDYANLISLCPSCHHSEEINPTISHIVPLIRERRSLINDCLFSKSNKATVYGTVRNEW